MKLSSYPLLLGSKNFFSITLKFLKPFSLDKVRNLDFTFHPFAYLVHLNSE